MDYDALLPYEGAQPSDIEHDAHVLVASYLPEPTSVTARQLRLPQPLCLPQITNTFDGPFARGFSPALNDVDISQETFLKFIDGLNMAIIASPPLQVVSTAGMIISMVPTPSAMAAGAAIQISAQVGLRVLSKSLTDRYLRAANESLFGPRRLRARLCKTPAMRILVGLADPNAKKPTKMSKFGKGVGEVVLKLPALRHAKRAVHAVMDAPPPFDPHEKDPTVRRMQQLQGYSLPISFAVPPPASPEGIIGMMNGYAVRYKQGKVTKKAGGVTARRQILAGESVSQDAMRGLSIRDRITTHRAAMGMDRRLTQRVKDDNLKEHLESEKLVWLVVMNEEQDQVIQGVERADDPSNEVAFNQAELNQSRKSYEEELGGDFFDAGPSTSNAATGGHSHGDAMGL